MRQNTQTHTADGKRAAAAPALDAPETWPSRGLRRDCHRPAASANVTRATQQQSTRHTNETHQVSQELVVDASEGMGR